MGNKRRKAKAEPKAADWECGWEDARERSLVAGLDATPAERLQWLADAIKLAYQTGALPRRAGDDERDALEQRRGKDGLSPRPTQISPKKMRK